MKRAWRRSKKLYAEQIPRHVDIKKKGICEVLYKSSLWYCLPRLPSSFFTPSSLGHWLGSVIRNITIFLLPSSFVHLKSIGLVPIVLVLEISLFLLQSFIVWTLVAVHRQKYHARLCLLILCHRGGGTLISQRPFIYLQNSLLCLVNTELTNTYYQLAQ